MLLTVFKNRSLIIQMEQVAPACSDCRLTLQIPKHCYQRGTGTSLASANPSHI